MAIASRAMFMGPVLALTLLGVFLISLPNLADPMIRHDDYPALFADPAGFWEKTLHEGRWLNYLWHLRGAVTPAWLNFAVYQVLWALFAASLATLAMRRTGATWFSVVLALIIVVSPSASLISLWFNTLLPGLALVALYAVLACHLSQRTHRLLLLPFTVAGFMAYTMYPVLMLAVCLIRTDRRSIPDLVGLLAWFTACFAAAVLATYSMNWFVHGIFGVPLADWRTANPASDLAGMIANAPLVTHSVTDFLNKSSFDFQPALFFHLGLFTLATLVLLRRAPREAIYLHAGLWTGMALVVVQVLKLGVIVPPRAFLFAWVIYAVLITRAAQELSEDASLAGRLARNAVLLIVGSYMLQTFMQYSEYRAWQGETRDLAAIAATSPEPLLVEGDVMQLTSARRAFVQTPLALQYRVQQLTGAAITLCETDPEGCNADTPRFVIAQSDGQIRLAEAAQPGIKQPRAISLSD